MSARKQILQAAEELFFHYGIKTITMDDIAKHLGISKRTIYENFATKDEVVSSLMNNHLEHMVETCRARFAGSSNAIEEIILMMQNMREMFSRMNPHILFDLKKFHPKVWKRFKDFKNDFLLKSITDNIERGKTEGIYRKNIDVAVLARMRIEQVEMVWNPEIFPFPTFDLKEVQLSILEHFLYGITNIKGHKMVEKYKNNKSVTV
jgi:AcrR family transcriptional regulator